MRPGVSVTLGSAGGDDRGRGPSGPCRTRLLQTPAPPPPPLAPPEEAAVFVPREAWQGDKVGETSRIDRR